MQFCDIKYGYPSDMYGNFKVGIKNKYIGLVNDEKLLAFVRTFLGYHNHTLSIHYPYTIHTPSIDHP